MTTRALCWSVVMVVVGLLPGAAIAQAPTAPPEQAARPATPPPVTPETIEPQGYTYDAAGRRDPFVSLLRRGAEGRMTGGTRPAGLAGLLVGEVTVRGTLQSREGYVGILQGADNRTYIVRPGDRLLDGTVRAIGADAVIFLQQVNDPLSLQKQREVRKGIRQTEEAR